MAVEIAMITGYSEGVARAVSEELDIDTYFAEVLPDDKDKQPSKTSYLADSDACPKRS